MNVDDDSFHGFLESPMERKKSSFTSSVFFLPTRNWGQDKRTWSVHNALLTGFLKKTCFLSQCQRSFLVSLGDKSREKKVFGMLSLISARVDKVVFLVVLLLVFLLQTPDFIKGSPLSSNNLSDQDAAQDSSVLFLSAPFGKSFQAFFITKIQKVHS